MGAAGGGRIGLVVAFLLLLGASAPALAVEEVTLVYADRGYGVRDGLPAAQVLCLYEDRNGAVWAGTTGGLARLGGPEIEVFGLAEGLPRAPVHSVAEGPDGTLFVGTLGGIARFDGHALRREKGPGSVDRRVHALEAAPDGTLFALVGRQGLLRLEHDAWVELERPPGVAFDGTGLAVDAHGHLWVAAEEGLVELLPEAESPKLRLGARYGPEAGFEGGAFSVVADGEGVAATSRAAVHRIRPSGVETLAVPASLGQGARTLARGGAGRLYVGTDRGVLVVGEDGVRPLRSARGLASGNSVCLMGDRVGNLWMGTVADGVHLVFTGAGVLHLRIADRPVRGHLVDADGFHWAATDRGLRRFRFDGGRPSAAVEVEARGVAPVFFDLAADAEGNLVVGTETGVGVLPAASRREDHPVLRRDARFGSVARAFVPAVARDDRGAVWVATRRGVFVLPPHGREATRVSLTGLADDAAYDLVRDRADVLWVVDDHGGLYRLPPGDPRRPSKVSLPGAASVEYLGLDPDGNALASFEDGAWLRLDARRGTITLMVPPDAELGGLAVHSLTAAGSGRYLAAYGRDRLSVVSLDPPRVVAPVLSSADLDDADFRYLTLHTDPAGGTWIEMLSGVAYVPVLPQPAPPRPLTLWSLGLEHPDATSTPAAPRLGPRPNAVDVVLSLADPLAPRKAVYRWRLVGESERWSAWSSEPRVRISNLEGGSFVLEAEGRDRYGRPSANAVSLPLRVEPVVWETWPFRAALTALVLLFAFAGYRLRVQALKRDRTRLEAAVAERSAELARANAELREAALTDPLTQLRNRRYFTASVEDDLKRVARLHGRLEDAPANRDLVFHLLDLDHFKDVNDTYGHAAGDGLLVQVAARLASVVRQSDLLIRWGGEEFLIVSRESQREEGPTVANRILQAIGGEPFDVGEGRRLRRTCSVGWAPYPWVPGQPEGVGLADIMRLADRALYLAKQEGRNRAVGVQALEDAGVPAFSVPLADADGQSVRLVRTLGPPAA